MNGSKPIWLWRVTGGKDWRGVAGTFDRARQHAETCMRNGGKAAVIESALLVFSSSAMWQEYALTGRRCTASRAGGRVQWTELAWSTAESA